MADKNKISELKTKILDYIKENGPVLPTDISKHMGGNLIFASAILSEFVSNKLLKMSHSKIGGSRVYYMPGQEDKLVMIHKHLPERPRKAFELLQENRVLRDTYCEPWERVALREIKDFAVPLTVKTEESEEVFWRWFAVSDDEATEIIRQVLEKEEPRTKEPVVEEVPVVQEQAEIPVENNVEEVQEAPKKKSRKKKQEEQQTLPAQQSPPASMALHSEDEFTSAVLSFFSANSIFIIDQKLLKRNKEIKFVIEFASTIGKSCYYVRAKNKKKISDKDIGDAFDEAKKENLPLLFVSNGELTKKAQNVISNNLRGIVFRQL